MTGPLYSTVRYTGQTGATHLASSTPTWTAPTGASSQTHTSSGPTASPSTTPAAACTGWTPSIMSSRGPTWTDATARPSSATVNYPLLWVFSSYGIMKQLKKIAPTMSMFLTKTCSCQFQQKKGRGSCSCFTIKALSFLLISLVLMKPIRNTDPPPTDI